MILPPIFQLLPRRGFAATNGRWSSSHQIEGSRKLLWMKVPLIDVKIPTHCSPCSDSRLVQSCHVVAMCRQITLTREMSRLWRPSHVQGGQRRGAGTPTGSNLRPLSAGQPNKCPVSPPNLRTCGSTECPPSLIMASNLCSQLIRHALDQLAE